MQHSGGSKPRAYSSPGDAADKSGARPTPAPPAPRVPGAPDASGAQSSVDATAASVVARALNSHSNHPARWEEEPVTDVWRAQQSSWADVHAHELIPSAPPPPRISPSPREPSSTAAAPTDALDLPITAMPIPPAPRAPSSVDPSSSVPARSNPMTIPSTGPVAFDAIRTAPPPTLRSLVEPSPRAQRVRAVVTTVAVMAALTLGIAGLRFLSLPPNPPPARAVALPPPPPIPAPLPTLTAPGVTAPLPAEAPPHAPVATGTTGTIVGTRDHRLYVDGHIVQSGRAEVTCGQHSVRNGSRGPYRKIDVPCGGEIDVPTK